MIFTELLKLPYYFLSFFISLLPASEGFPPEVMQGASFLGSQIGIFEPILPIATLSIVLTILIGAEIGIWSFKTFKWVFSHIPVIGGKG